MHSKMLLLALLVGGSLGAQTMKETIEVNLLELEVAVLDRSGKPVHGLTREEFEVRVGNRRVEVANFFAVERGAIVDEPSSPPSAIAATTSLPTTVMIFVDDTRLGQRAKLRILDAVKDYVRANVGANTSAMLVRFNGSLDVLTRPSERPGPLLAELDRIAQQPALLRTTDRQLLVQQLDDSLSGVYIERPDMTPRFMQLWHMFNAYAEQQAREVEQTLDALRRAVKLASAFEGRKVLLYASEGLPMTPGVELFDYWQKASTSISSGAIPEHQELAQKVSNTFDFARYDRSREFARVAREAQAAKVMVFAVDAGGIRADATIGAENAAAIGRSSPLLMRANEQDGIRYVANETGGRFVANDNNLGRALAVMSEQFATYYSLGVRAPRSARLTNVRVAVKGKPELRVMTARQRRPLSPEEEIERAVRSRLYTMRAENPLGAELTVGASSLLDGRCIVPLHVTSPRPTAIAHFALLDERQQESDVRTATPSLMSLGLKPGQYVISIALVDPETGETAYLQRAFDACR